MRTTRGALAACLAMAMASGCDGKEEPAPKPTLEARLPGAWMECKPGDADSNVDVLAFDDPSVTVTPIAFATPGCTGEGSVGAPNAGTYAIGRDLRADLGGVLVTASELDLTLGGETGYTLGYVDTAATPHRLYFGDDGGVLDGSTPALRPTKLSEARPLVKGGPYEPFLQGAWVTCKVSDEGSNLDVLTFSGLAVTRTGDAYTTGDCTGTPTPMAPASGTITLGAAVTATFGDTTVTALELDVTMDGTDYTLGYVDFAATPDRLHLGTHTPPNDGSTPALRPTALDVTRYFERE